MENLNFGKDFIWGAATAAYQIEGGVSEGGRTPSIWDTFCHTPYKIRDGFSADVACDHFHRVDEDVALMKAAGLKAYRFSISWSRLCPDGFHECKEGVDFYNHLIDKLLENGILPFITMYHWDLPQSLEDMGGWRNPEISNWFENYASIIVKNFGDRCKNMITLNEPSIFLKMGYQDGEYAPGLKCTEEECIRMVHNILMAHGKAVRQVRLADNNIKVGITLANAPLVPFSETSKEDKRQARESQNYSGDRGKFYLYAMRIWGDPIFLGRYPQGFLNTYGHHLIINEGDFDTISQPIDFLGLNSYTSTYVSTENGLQFLYKHRGEAISGTGWTTIPSTLYYVTKYFYDAYHCPIYITENGYCGFDVVSLDGKVHDPQRIDYFEKYLAGLKQAKNEGVDIRGYFTWSLMDNFEWSSGFDPRFGIIYVDYMNNCERIPKDSYFWYRDLIQIQHD